MSRRTQINQVGFSGMFRRMAWGLACLLVVGIPASAASSPEKARQMLSLLLPRYIVDETTVVETIRKFASAQPGAVLSNSQAQCIEGWTRDMCEELYTQQGIVRIFDNDTQVDRWLDFARTEAGNMFFRMVQDPDAYAPDGPYEAEMDDLSDKQKQAFMEFMMSAEVRRFLDAAPMQSLSDKEDAKWLERLRRRCGLTLQRNDGIHPPRLTIATRQENVLPIFDNLKC